MKKRIQQNVMIKGTKDGFMLHLDDSCSFSDLLIELDGKLSENYQLQENDPLLSVKLHTGNRFLNQEQEKQVIEVIRKHNKIDVTEVRSNVMSMERAKRWKEEHQMTTMNRVIRSGQIIEVQGDLLLIGDVNPDGIVRAGGSIFIMGQLKGIAHAGYYGNDQAIIAASVMNPAQIRIADYVKVAPERYESSCGEMECAFINDEHKMIIDKLHVLKKYRPNFDRLEGGL